MTDIDPRAPQRADSREPNIHLAPAAAAKLTEDQQARLASRRAANGGDLAGWHSIGNSHKPKHASGRQGPPEKKVRW